MQYIAPWVDDCSYHHDGTTTEVETMIGDPQFARAQNRITSSRHGELHDLDLGSNRSLL